MSLIKCPECKKQISDTAKKCPNCGYSEKNKKIKEKTDKLKAVILKYKNVFIIAILLILICLIIYNSSWRRTFEIIKDNNGFEINTQGTSWCCGIRINFDLNNPNSKLECGNPDLRYCGGEAKVTIKNKKNNDYYSCIIFDYFDNEKKIIGQSEQCFSILANEEKTVLFNNPYDYVEDIKVNKVIFSKERIEETIKINEEKKHIKTKSAITKQTNSGLIEYNGTIYELNKLSNDQNSSDRFVNAVNEYLDDIYKLNFDKKIVENGYTFYSYKASDDTSLSLIFTNSTSTFHCLTIIEKNNYGYFTKIRKAAALVANQYNKCYSTSSCWKTLLFQDAEVKVGEYTFGLSTIADGHIFTIMSDN